MEFKDLATKFEGLTADQVGVGLTDTPTGLIIRS